MRVREGLHKSRLAVLLVGSMPFCVELDVRVLRTLLDFATPRASGNMTFRD